MNIKDYYLNGVFGVDLQPRPYELQPQPRPYEDISSQAVRRHRKITSVQNAFKNDSKIQITRVPYTQYDIPRVPTGLTTVNIPKKIIFNDPATIVYWADGTKTVVKTMPGTEFNEYYGFVCALAKHIYGTNSSINHIIDIASKNGRTE